MSNPGKPYFDKKTINDFSVDNENSGATFKLNKVIYWVPQKDQVISCRCSSTEPVAVVEIAENFLYMDVGSWGGDGGDNHFPKRRDFGVVCGQVAALCTFKKPASGDPDYSEVNDDLKKNEDFKRLDPLLKKLSGNANLGQLKVAKALFCASNFTQPTNEKIYVILGDLHLPIMTDQNKTYVKDSIGRTEKPGDAYRMGRLMFDRDDVARIVSHLKEIVVEWKKSGKEIAWDFVKNPLSITILQIKLIDALIGLLGVLVKISNDASISAWPDNRKMDKTDAEKWFKFYHGENGKKGADIFENAAADLTAWLNLLAEYQDGSPQCPVQLVQVGDFFDFWIGLGIPMALEVKTIQRSIDKPLFEMNFKGNGELKVVFWSPNITSQDLALFGIAKLNCCEVTLRYTGIQQQFVNFWLNATQTSTGSDIQKAISTLFTNGPKLNALMLAGNHDNYIQFGYGSKPKIKFLENTKSEKGFEGIYIDHGLVSDKFNRNDTFPLGWLLTQAAFVDPTVREIEEELGRLVDSSGSRLQRITGAIKLCGETKKGMYVMGHTHAPFLIEVQVNNSYKKSYKDIRGFMEQMVDGISQIYQFTPY